MPVITGPELVAGLRTTFRSTYDALYEGIVEKLAPIIETVPSDKRIENYAYQTSAAPAKRWPRNKDVQFEGFDSVGFSIENLNWGGGVDWHEDDRADDLLKNLYTRARDTGESLALVQERVAFQMLTGGTDSDLLPTVPNCPDGAAMFSTTDGATNPRYGVTNGNSLTGTGSTSPDIRIDFFTGYGQFKSMQNTKGQPLHSLNSLDKGFLIFYAGTQERQFLEAFKQPMTLQIVKTVAASENVGGAAVSSIVPVSGLSVDLVGTARLTGTPWYMAMKGSPVKPIIRQVREAPRESVSLNDSTPGDLTKTSGKEYIVWKAREGYGPNLTFGILKMTPP